MSKNVLVTGATGNQGGGLVHHLANHPDFTVLATTRNASGAGAEKLKSKAKNIKVVQGDQDNVPALFQAAKEATNGEPIWGVFSLQVSAHDGNTAGEIAQGKAMVDEAVKSGVKHFVYASVERGGDDASWKNETPIPHFQTKYHIEQYLRDNAGGMGWTILRPVAFMDNLKPGFPAKVFMAACAGSMDAKKKQQWIACKDIGAFARIAFEKPSEYNHKALGLAGDELTIDETCQALENKSSASIRPTFWFLGSFLKYMVQELGIMITWFGTDGYKADIPKLRNIYPQLMTFEDWVEKESPFPGKY